MEVKSLRMKYRCKALSDSLRVGDWIKDRISSISYVVEGRTSDGFRCRRITMTALMLRAIEDARDFAQQEAGSNSPGYLIAREILSKYRANWDWDWRDEVAILADAMEDISWHSTTALNYFRNPMPSQSNYIFELSEINSDFMRITPRE